MKKKIQQAAAGKLQLNPETLRRLDFNDQRFPKVQGGSGTPSNETGTSGIWVCTVSPVGC